MRTARAELTAITAGESGSQTLSYVTAAGNRGTYTLTSETAPMVDAAGELVLVAKWASRTATTRKTGIYCPPEIARLLAPTDRKAKAAVKLRREIVSFPVTARNETRTVHLWAEVSPTVPGLAIHRPPILEWADPQTYPEETVGGVTLTPTNGSQWTVTHLHSGKYAADRLSRADAVALLAALAPIGDWRRPFKQFTPDEKAAALAAVNRIRYPEPEPETEPEPAPPAPEPEEKPVEPEPVKTAEPPAPMRFIRRPSDTKPALPDVGITRESAQPEVAAWCKARHLPAYIVGKWVWCYFETIPSEAQRAELKAAGFAWVQKRKGWAHAGGGYTWRRSRAPYDPRTKYGAEAIDES